MAGSSNCSVVISAANLPPGKADTASMTVGSRAECAVSIEASIPADSLLPSSTYRDAHDILMSGTKTLERPRRPGPIRCRHRRPTRRRVLDQSGR
jgi:hypothetical protein